MPHFHRSDAPHWYCHLEMDVIDATAAAKYLREQTFIEEANGMHTFEFFADDPANPGKVVLLECFRDLASQDAHIANIRMETFAMIFENFRLRVYGNPPQAAIDRMAEVGFWPPAFEGAFIHMPYFMGFRAD